jgi:hypothetical protein
MTQMREVFNELEGSCWRNGGFVFDNRNRGTRADVAFTRWNLIFSFNNFHIQT